MTEKKKRLYNPGHLDHEVPDDPVELRSLVSLANGLLLGQLDEVLGGDGDGFAEHADDDGAHRNAADFDIEEDLKKLKPF